VERPEKRRRLLMEPFDPVKHGLKADFHLEDFAELKG